MRTLKRAMHFSLLSGLVVGALAALPGTGHAAAGTSSASVSNVGGRLQLNYVGSADANGVRISLESGTNALVVSDSVSISPAGGCVAVPNNPTTVRCSVGITLISARLGGGADTFSTLVPLKGTVEGEGGNDTFRPSRSVGAIGAATSEIMYAGGLGEDTATYAGVPATGPTGNTGVHVTLDLAANDGRDADGSRPADKDNVQVENLIGSSFGDRLSGDGQDNEITAGNGRDTVSGGNGNDVVNVQDQAAENSVSCGEGTGDVAIADRFALDPVNVDCETVQRGA
ncbi:hypothetical protein ETD86_20100 [Nonomuraea turkmeniaca]|uniref:Calcium-binding protein n=1 Tax=Nonomuraea turkmeniaca TaxID=103838 RepID=A0A5S4FIY0_9ACTN|nr:hypothetical protein [Nonomuraea turkmeniaca]TMR19376.1 hypothetical protein ETD86_20100 [Nonomuraea turkmeniaca]